jgi:enoyl-CoA hydratase
MPAEETRPDEKMAGPVTAGPVRYALEGRIATITMDDGKVNVFSIPMLKALHAAFDQAENDGAVVVLTGRDRCFSAGFDLKALAGGRAEVVEILTLGATLAERVLSFPTPVLVACTGHAYPAGAFLLLAADLRIGVAGPFRIGLNEVKIGMTIPWFAIELARHRLHPAHFDRTVVNATMFNPSEAVAAGFLDQVVEADALAEACRAGAATLAELDPGAHAATKLRARAPALEALRSAIESELGA